MCSRCAGWPRYERILNMSIHYKSMYIFLWFLCFFCSFAQYLLPGAILKELAVGENHTIVSSKKAKKSTWSRLQLHMSSTFASSIYAIKIKKCFWRGHTKCSKVFHVMFLKTVMLDRKNLETCICPKWFVWLRFNWLSFIFIQLAQSLTSSLENKVRKTERSDGAQLITVGKRQYHLYVLAIENFRRLPDWQHYWCRTYPHIRPSLYMVKKTGDETNNLKLQFQYYYSKSFFLSNHIILLRFMDLDMHNTSYLWILQNWHFCFSTREIFLHRSTLSCHQKLLSNRSAFRRSR